MAAHPPVLALLDAHLQASRGGQRTLVMGVLNVTPDSFSDGGAYLELEAACRRAVEMAEQGADIIDVGGVSTRPGAAPVSSDEELRRVLPVVERIVGLAADRGAVVSVDTTSSEVARRALEAGAAMVNDVSAMTWDAAMPPVVAGSGAAVCLMHMRGTPADMQRRTDYVDVVGEVRAWLAERAESAIAAGVARERIVVDPGFGFAKTPEQNLELLHRLREVAALGYPVLSGWSRKSTIGRVLGGLPADERLEGTAAAVALSVSFGASIVRVHDVKEMSRVTRMADAVVRGNWRDEP